MANPLMSLIRGFPGKPSHPPLTDVAIGAYRVGVAMLVAGALGLEEEADGKPEGRRREDHGTAPGSRTRAARQGPGRADRRRELGVRERKLGKRG